ncbi:flavodoxin domain-containing protein [Caldisalinibacter kiritimatiensis]|uniref:Pyridoxamine 5'-phosphate oxidase-related, FMN-binding protein n=1 Tax=Caldisalinibacter kiritimatiensis TaxID=1304284 RepID=R1CPF4_9FIRM|nr:flavodoxin domain-containing protein [Caldisalinibacter kiritimatiensis]EOD00546.1 pyridoxamine 5'-phosphate oxidase-related, FMN-binding protein [Caldisalinibacter kiritimatiensis]
MKRTLILYESKYGATEEIVKNMAYVLGPCKYCTTENFKEEYKKFDFFVIGSPVYYERIDDRIYEFTLNNKAWLQNKTIALFCTCMAKNGDIYLNNLKRFLGKSVVHVKTLGGKVNLKSLDKYDYNNLKSFYKSINMPFRSMDLSNKEEVIKYALHLKRIKDRLFSKMPKRQLISYIEEFLSNHNTCTLATYYKSRIRSTPIEYVYNNKALYFLTEGGEKFSNILFNTDVSISIYEPYKDMNSLAGMQISGNANIVKRNSDEYNEILRLKGLNPSVIANLPVLMNMIKVIPNKIEFLNSKFKGMGYDAKQVYVIKKES